MVPFVLWATAAVAVGLSVEGEQIFSVYDFGAPGAGETDVAVHADAAAGRAALGRGPQKEEVRG